MTGPGPPATGPPSGSATSTFAPPTSTRVGIGCIDGLTGTDRRATATTTTIGRHPPARPWFGERRPRTTVPLAGPVPAPLPPTRRRVPDTVLPLPGRLIKRPRDPGMRRPPRSSRRRPVPVGERRRSVVPPPRVLDPGLRPRQPFARVTALRPRPPLARVSRPPRPPPHRDRDRRLRRWGSRPTRLARRTNLPPRRRTRWEPARRPPPPRGDRWAWGRAHRRLLPRQRRLRCR